jgi:hypothetical protein
MKSASGSSSVDAMFFDDELQHLTQVWVLGMTYASFIVR